jgi:hypothetical protein
MGLHDPFEYLKHKLWSKEGLGIKLPIWLPSIKSQELPWFICLQVACHISLEGPWRGIQLCFRSHFNRRSTQEIMALQSARSPNFGKFGNPMTKWHLGASPVAKHREHYKGEGGGFLQVWAMMSLMSLCLPVARLCIKNVPTIH